MLRAISRNQTTLALAQSACDLADERGPGHVARCMDSASLQTSVVLEEFDHDSRVVGQHNTSLLRRIRLASHLVSPKVPDASTATYASKPCAIAVIAGKPAHTSIEMPAKISFLRFVPSMALATRGSSEAFHTRAIDHLNAGQRFDECGKRRSPHANDRG